MAGGDGRKWQEEMAGNGRENIHKENHSRKTKNPCQGKGFCVILARMGSIPHCPRIYEVSTLTYTPMLYYSTGLFLYARVRLRQEDFFMARSRKEINAKYDAKRAGKRTRNWTFLVWLESAPENWREVISSHHTPWVESPLHEGELNPDNEQEKSPHWHVLMMFDSMKTFEQVKEITDSLSTTIPQQANNPKGIVRYMAHLDNPEKKQYKASDIKGHCGADVGAFFVPTSALRRELILEMMDYVDTECVREIADLMKYAGVNRQEDWFYLLTSDSMFVMSKYIDSRRNSFDRDQNGLARLLEENKTLRARLSKYETVNQPPTVDD